MSLTFNGLCLILYLPVTLSFGEFRVQKRRYRVQIPWTLSRPNAQESQHRQQGGFTNRAQLWGVSAAFSCPLGSHRNGPGPPSYPRLLPICERRADFAG